MERKWPDYSDTSANPRWRWRRTFIGGEIAPNDWCLYDGAGKWVARIARVEGGPRHGQWRYALGISQEGEYRNGGSGYCETGTAAREICESLVPGAIEALSPKRR